MKPLATILFLLLAACAAQPARDSAAVFTHGVASGDMRGDSAVLWTRTREAATLVPEISATPGFEAPVRLAPVEARADDDFTVHALASGLRAGSRYYYRFAAGGATSPVGTFRTPYAPDDHAPVRMAFTGDADWKWKPYPLAASLAQENVDFFFFLGDVVYESLDYDGKTFANDLPGYRAKYRENREPHPASRSGMVPLRDLYAAFGQYSVFDNHELGDDPEGGARTDGEFVNRAPPFRAGVRAFAEYQPVRPVPITGTGDARADGTDRFYYSLPWGANVELIVVDDRSYRDARIEKTDDPQAGSCSRTMLGAAQLAWFEGALAAAQQRGAVWKVVIISSPIEEFGRPSQVGYDFDSFKGWAGNYRCERSRILKFIDDHAIDNVVFLTTDYHFTSVNQLLYDTTPGDERSPRRHARNAFEIITGPMGAIAGSPFRDSVPIANQGTREADARIVTLVNGLMKKAGLDPIGLEADFPGLDVASMRTLGRAPGTLDPVAFASWATYSYAVLTFDQSELHVQLKTMPYVDKPRVLADNPSALAEYEARRPVEMTSFVVKAMGGAR
jgi:phosphodiesterase/alkaline phosphatase D-like protein